VIQQKIRSHKPLPKVLTDPVGGLLLRAADYLDEHGLCRGRPSEGGRVCLLESLACVDGGDSKWARSEATRRLNSITEALGYPNCWEWSDRASTTKDEAVAVLRRAAG
jgi:hypothetical protein